MIPYCLIYIPKIININVKMINKSKLLLYMKSKLSVYSLQQRK